MSKTLDGFQDDIGAWGDTTFPQSTVKSVIAHFREEADEFTSYPGEGEAADCFILLLQYAHKSGFSLADAVEAKMAINQRRRWKPDPEPEGHTKHIEDSPL